jgi:hypothetical protein
VSAGALRVHVVVASWGAPVPPGTCPACRGVLDDVGCRIEVARHVRPRAVRRTGVRSLYTVACRGALDPARLLPCPACPPGGEAEG